MSPAPLRVAVLGAGTVGLEVVRGFLDHPERLVPFDGRPLELVAVAERAIARAVAAGIPAELLTDAPAHLVAAPEVDVIVELIGGDEPAHTLVAAALGAGKSVVTANKHVIAHHGPEFERIARGAGAALRFEAAVGGGIPVLGPLAGDLAANRVRRIRGIVNGTTNYILSTMAAEGRSYADALAAAQRAGYAEVNPTADVEGLDAANKLVILVRLAFGVWLDPEGIPTCPPTSAGEGRPGVTGVTAAEIAGATRHGLAIKLVATAERRADGLISAGVQPVAVSLSEPLGRTDGVLNRIEVEAEPVGSVAFAGPGAGGAATASAVLGDLLALARGAGSTWAGLPPATEAAEPPRATSDPAEWFFVADGPPDGSRGTAAAADPAAGAEGGACRTGPLRLEDVQATLAGRSRAPQLYRVLG